MMDSRPIVTSKRLQVSGRILIAISRSCKGKRRYATKRLIVSDDEAKQIAVRIVATFADESPKKC
jgi:hypothetical protein